MTITAILLLATFSAFHVRSRMIAELYKEDLPMLLNTRCFHDANIVLGRYPELASDKELWEGLDPKEDKDIILFLLTRGFPLDIYTQSSLPLDTIDLAKALQSSRTELNPDGFAGPLKYAFLTEDTKLATTLIELGANINHSASGEPAYFLRTRSHEMLEFAINNGANLTLCADNGDTILHRLAQAPIVMNHTVALLLENSADALPTEAISSAEKIAAQVGHFEMARMLHEAATGIITKNYAGALGPSSAEDYELLAWAMIANPGSYSLFTPQGRHAIDLAYSFRFGPESHCAPRVSALITFALTTYLPAKRLLPWILQDIEEHTSDIRTMAYQSLLLGYATDLDRETQERVELAKCKLRAKIEAGYKADENDAAPAAAGLLALNRKSELGKHALAKVMTTEFARIEQFQSEYMRLGMLSAEECEDWYLTTMAARMGLCRCRCGKWHKSVRELICQMAPSQELANRPRIVAVLMANCPRLPAFCERVKPNKPDPGGSGLVIRID